MNILNTVLMVAHEAHAHDEEHGSVWTEAWGLITDPSHAITEIFYSLLFDALVIPLTILIYKKIREPKLRREIHAEIDTEHGITHSECSSETPPNAGSRHTTQKTVVSEKLTKIS
jgi:hypothetical protein